MGMPTCRIYSERNEVKARLAELGLDENELVDSLAEGDQEASWCTENDPRIMSGFIRWGKSFRGLADRLVLKGWAHKERRSLPLMINSNRTIALAVSSADDNTGRADTTMPKTRNPKGEVTRQIVYENQPQLPGIANAVTRIRGRVDDLRTWFLLFFVDRQTDEIRSELSLAASIASSGQVGEWYERIILSPTTPTTPVRVKMPYDQDGDTAEDDIVIRPREGA
jgi:hypothetical protein